MRTQLLLFKTSEVSHVHVHPTLVKVEHKECRVSVVFEKKKKKKLMRDKQSVVGVPDGHSVSWSVWGRGGGASSIRILFCVYLFADVTSLCSVCPVRDFSRISG